MASQVKNNSFFAQVVEFIGLLFLVFLIRTFVFGLYQVPSGSMETTMLVGERFLADKLSYWIRVPTRGEVIACNAPTFVYSKNKFKYLFEKYVWGPENWTKRIIGLPGDHVKGVIEDGKPVVYVNGSKLDEPYINSYPLAYVWRKDPRELTTMSEGSISSQHIMLRSFEPEKSFQEQSFYRFSQNRLIADEYGAVRLIYPGTPSYSTGNAGRWDGSDEFDVVLASNEYWVMGDNRLGSSDSRVFGPIKEDSIHGRIIFRIWSIDSEDSWWIVDLIKHPIDFWTRVRWNRFFNVLK